MEKYLIFYKDIIYGPRKKNNSIEELSIEEAKACVKMLNQRSGENIYFYMEEKEWLKQLELEVTQEDMEDPVDVEKIWNSLDIGNIAEFNCKENDKNINGFMAPFEADNNKDYEIKLRSILSNFMEEIDRPAFRKEGILVDDIKKICKNVIEALQMAKAGNIKMAEEILAEILENYKKYPFAVSELNNSYAFRGVAPFNNLRQRWGSEEIYESMMKGDLNFFRARVVPRDEIIQEKKDINYLPYSKRSLARDMRFSSRKNVCLYLGVTSYVWSKECRWNGKDNLYLSAFKFNENGKKLKILNLVVVQALINGMIPNSMNSSYCKELHNGMLRVFPLVIATMFRIDTSDEERKEKYGEMIKEEYLLSQILMNVLQKVGIDGVAYLSRQGKNDFQFPQMVNLAIPVIGASEKHEYGKLIDYFSMTSPILFNGFTDNSMYKGESYINKSYPKYLHTPFGKVENYNAKIDYNGKTVFYQDTQYSKFDDYLINQIHKKFIE